MEPESSLSFTQQSVTAVCPEADDCRPQPHSHSSKMNFNLSSQEPHGVLVCPTRATCHTHFIILIIFYAKTWNDEVPIMQFSIPSCYFLLSPDIPLSTVFSALKPYPYRYVKGQVSRTVRATGKIRVVHISLFAVFNDGMVSLNFDMNVILIC